MTATRHSAIVLAAGASRRLGRAKQLLAQDGESLLHRTVRAVLATQPARALVVVGAQADEVFATLAGAAVQRVDCADWSEGMAASLRAGLGACAEDCPAVLVTVCDQPALTAAHLCALVALWRSAPDRAVASLYAGTLGVPAVLPRSWFAALAALCGDQGARHLLRERAHEVAALAAAQLALDIDTPQDLDAL